MIRIVLFALAAACHEQSCASAAPDIAACRCTLDQGARYAISIRRGDKVIYEGSREMVTFGGSIEVFTKDLDGDGRAEIIAADDAGTSNGIGIRYWNLTIVDGRSDAASVTPLVEYGEGVIRNRSVLVTSWEWMGGHLYFVARPHTWANGALRPDKARGMWRRRYLFSFERERNATPGRPGRWLKRAAHVAWSDPTAQP